MKQVKEVVEADGSERSFTMTLTDGSSSPFVLVKDDGEWVLQGDEKQRFSRSELRAILQKLDILNIQPAKKDNNKKEVKKKK